MECELSTTFTEIYAWRHGHVFWIPMFSWDKQHRLVCDKCGREDRFGFASSDRIARWDEVVPWMHRFGWLLPTIALAVYIATQA